MIMFFDPVAQSLASWKLVGQTVEQQLRISYAVTRAFLGQSAASEEPCKGQTEFSSARKAARATPAQSPAPSANSPDKTPKRRKRAPSAPPAMPEKASTK
jgi:hypothetical protein